MSITTIKKVYDRYASFYNVVFGSIFGPGRSACVDLINKTAANNASILEIGIGTGLSLPLYREDLFITGIDISEKMLEKAEEQRAKLQLPERVLLRVMDAEHLLFAENQFDYVVAMYVASVVPDVNAFLREIHRVAKPDAEIIFVNHFSSDNKLMHFLEEKFSSVNDLVGFKSNFSMDSILHDAHFKLIESKKVNLFGYWRMLHCKLQKERDASLTSFSSPPNKKVS